MSPHTGNEDVARSYRITMNTLRKFFHIGARQTRATSSRFDRYYIGVLETGAGFPTADEARKDLINFDKSFSVYTWPR